MSVAAKMRHTINNVEIVINGIPAKEVKLSNAALKKIFQLVSSLKSPDDEELIPAEEVFPELKDPVKRGATSLRIFRHRNKLTQVELAKQIEVTQGDISAMEKGKRAIGKTIAKRLADVFKCDYRVFL